MIRTTTSFKQSVAFGLLSMALVSAACSDDGDAVSEGDAGKGGSSSTAGKTNTGGNNTSGKSAGGSAAAGKAGGGDTSVAGNGGSANTAGTSGTSGTSGSAGEGGEGGGAGAAGAGGAGGGEGGASAGGEGGASVGGEGGVVGSSGAGGDGPGFVADVLDNPGFENGTAHAEILPGWTVEGTPGAAYIEYSGARTGFGKLGHWVNWENDQTPAYTARTYQTVDPIANGTYSFSIWVDRNWEDTQYLYAKGFNAADPDEEMKIDTEAAKDPAGYVKITLSGIAVTSGRCTVGVYTASAAGVYANFDDAEFTLE